jgi:hypothetical protein
MAADIRGNARKILDTDTARALVATAVGEAIRRVGTTREQTSARVSNVRLVGAGGFAAGAGAAAIAQVATKRIARLITGRGRSSVLAQAPRKMASGARRVAEAPSSAMDSVVTKLGGGSGTGQSSKTPSSSGPRSSSAKRPAASRGQRPRTRGANGAKSSRDTPRRSASAKPKSRAAGNASRAKRGSSSNGSTRTARATKSRSSNGTRASSGSSRSAAKPAASRRS